MTGRRGERAKGGVTGKASYLEKDPVFFVFLSASDSSFVRAGRAEEKSAGCYGGEGVRV